MRELRLPITNRLIGEHEAADQEHLSQISQTEFVAKPPKHHERYHIARILCPVQQATASFVELLGAVQTTEPAIALRGAFRSLPDGRRSAFRNARHFTPSTREIVAVTSRDQQSLGLIADRTLPGSPACPSADLSPFRA